MFSPTATMRSLAAAAMLVLVLLLLAMTAPISSAAASPLQNGNRTLAIANDSQSQSHSRKLLAARDVVVKWGELKAGSCTLSNVVVTLQHDNQVHFTANFHAPKPCFLCGGHRWWLKLKFLNSHNQELGCSPKWPAGSCSSTKAYFDQTHPDQWQHVDKTWPLFWHGGHSRLSEVASAEMYDYSC